MVGRKGAEYSDFMMNAGAWGWPTQCRVCRRWQAHALCTTCLPPSGRAGPRCLRCALPLPSSRVTHPDGLCALCEDEPPRFDHAIAAFDYEAPWSGLVAALKFRQDPALAVPLAGALQEPILKRWGLPSRPGQPALQRLRAGAPSLIVPVPLSAARLRERGYNQADRLARALGRTLRLPVQTDLVQRRRDTARLMSLDKDAREAHIRGAFHVPPAWRAAIAGRHVAVVDDVLTTGATLNAVSDALWRAGAREVSAWVLARTPRPHDADRSGGQQTAGSETTASSC